MVNFDVGVGVVVFDVKADVVGLEVGTPIVGWMLLLLVSKKLIVM